MTRNSRLLLALPAVCGISAVLGGAAIAGVSEPAMLGILAERPLAMVQITAGLGLWLALMVFPASRIALRLWKRRAVTITQDHVEITERTPLGRQSRCIPVSAYRGIAHHVRTSLSGLTHELVLVHDDPAFTIIIASGDPVTQGGLEAAKAMLGLPEIPARAIYERAEGPSMRPGASGLVPA